MSWISNFQKLIRIIEVENGLYCEHLPTTIDEDNIIVNIDGKKVCRKCCDHHAFKTFINKKSEEVCLLCCRHYNYNKDKMGNMFCVECFSEIPQNFCGANSKIISQEERRKRAIHNAKVLQQKKIIAQERKKRLASALRQKEINRMRRLMDKNRKMAKKNPS